MFTKSRIALATALAVSALSTTSAFAVPADAPGTKTPAASDHRSPDAREGAATAPAEDLRSPDARVPISEPLPSEPAVQPVVVETAPAGEAFDWTTAVIGAGGGLAIAVLAGTGIALGRRRQPRPTVG